MKKFGHILFCGVPIILAFAVQFLVSIPAVGIRFLSALINESPGASFYNFYNDLLYSFMDSSFTSWISLFYSIATIIIFSLWYQKRFHALDVAAIPSHFNGKLILGIVLLTPGLQYATTYLINFISMLRPQWLRSYESLMETAGLTDVSLILACYAVVLGPISEELIYRGVTLSYAKKELPFWAANLTQSILFGVYHMNILQGIYAFFIGLFLGFVCHKTKSIFPSMLLHICFNLWGVFATNELFMYKIDTPFFFIFWLVAGILLTVLGMFFIKSGSGTRNVVRETDGPFDM